MASSDDEGEPVVNNVSDYEFTYGADDESISFAMLPVEWSQGKAHDREQRKIYLKGKTDNGRRKIYVQVTAWKYDFPKAKPEISVLSVNGNWIKLLKPWNPFYKIIRTVLVTLHVLHFAKWNSQLSEKALWDNLNITFSLFERRPCADDLEEHVPLITEAMKRDVRLAKSKILSELLEKKPWEKKTLKEVVKPSFIVDDAIEKEDGGETDKTDEDEDNESEEGGDSDSEEGDCFDSVCAICDNGGNLMICDGKCLRSFHATVEDGDDSKCESLDLTDAELEAIKNVPFICENCKYKKHQCFACGKLGSSDELSNPEVFCCVNGACGYFYHPRCVAKLLHPGDNAAAEKLHKRISAGEPFACPIHKCHVCKELEGRSEPDTQFAVCRRCPKAYHRKCLPREIAFDDSNEDSDTEHIQRAWEGLIPKRILIYCLDHEIEEELCTPPRNHIIFPGPRQAKKKKLELESCRKKNLLKERSISLKNNAGNKISVRQQNTNDTKGGDLFRKRLEELPTRLSSKNQKLAATRNTSVKLKKSANDDTGVSSNDDGFYGTNSAPLISRSMATGHGNNEMIKKAKSTAKKTDDSVALDADAKRRLLALMEVASSSITIEDVKKQHKPPSTHVPYSRFSVDSVTLGKVQGSIQAVYAALEKLDVDGGSIQDAKAVCGNDLLEQVFRWKEKLKVYLAPFLHGMRYTSFGRHFTKLDKLKEIVDILHWYVQDGDMLVDFCCGSNDFSCLMKKKLDEMGRLCSFKNYDILQAKNDFNFERRDWMGVKKDELPDGSQLIMGLNPPFGVNASLANKFINKALEFKPKLLVLIVPRETQRLDEKESPYDLIWEDDQMLAGKSFYLPGSVDINDKQIEDWNKNAPILYLWSRPDCTPKHKAVAEQHCHLSGALKSYRLDESHTELPTPNSAQAIDHKISIGGEIKHADKTLEQMGKETISHREDLHADTPKNLEQMGKKDTISHREDLHADTPKNLEQMGKKDTISHRADMRAHTPKNVEQMGKETISHREDFPRSTEAGKNHTAVKNHSGSSSKSFGGKGNQKRPPSDMFPSNKSRSNLSESRHRQLGSANHLESYPSEHLGTPSQVYSERGNNQQQRNESNLSTYRQQAYSQTEYNGNGVNEFQHLNQQQHEDDRIVDEHLLRKYTGPAEEPRRSVSSRQAYDQSPRHGMSGMQAYDQSPRHGMSGMQAYGRSPNTEYAYGASSDQQRLAESPLYRSHVVEMYQNDHGRRVQQQQPDHWNPLGSAIPPPPPPLPPHLHHLHRYPHQLNTMGMSTPVTHRYASRLDEAQHGTMFPEREEEVRREYHLGRPQLPSQFAPGPYYPRYPTSSGWIQD